MTPPDSRRKGLYPSIEPYGIHRLKVGELHELHVEECGNAHGLPVVFLHGGPGGGSSWRHRRFFDPARYRMVLFDQRGAGRSTPRGEIRENSTAHLVADMERIRTQLGISGWVVFGGSWGSTLALAYAQQYPDRVIALVLRGLFLGSQEEIDWLNECGGGARYIFPERWSGYEQHVPEAERHAMVEAYWRRLDDPCPSVRAAAGYAWRTWTGGCTALIHDPSAEPDIDREAASIEARIEAHYFRHRCFLADGQLLRNVQRIRGIPATLVQGRYDIACPMRFSSELAAAWPELSMRVVMAGHSAFDEAATDALVRATDGYADLFCGTLASGGDGQADSGIK